MGRIRAFDVAQEGFRLVARRPLAVFVWGLLMTLVQTVVPFGVMGWLLFSQDGLWPLLMSADGGANTEALQAFELKVNLAQIAVLPLVMLVSVVVVGAAFRAILEPEASARFYMRVGKAEGWLLLVSLVASIVIGAPAIIVVLIAVAVTAMVAMASQVAAVVVGLMLGAAAIAAYAWIGARFMMAAPLTFTSRAFRLFESWPLTRGHAWFLVRVWLAMLILMIGSVIAVGIALFIILGVPLIIMAMPLMQSAQDVDPTLWFSQHLGLIVGLAVGFGVAYLAAAAFITGAYTAILVAPIARAFQILTLAPVEPSSEAPAEAVVP